MFEYSRWEEANTTLYKVEDWTPYYYVQYQELIPGSGLWTRKDDFFIYEGIIEQTIKSVPNKSWCLRGDVIALVENGRMYIAKYSTSLLHFLRSKEYSEGYKEDSFFVPLSTSGDITPWCEWYPPRY